MSNKDLKNFQKNIGYSFKDIEHLKIALTHKSFIDEEPTSPTNQRYEFIGDTILDFDLSLFLFDNYPNLDEGSLTKIRSGAVDIIVIDSVAALTPKSEIEGEMGDSKMGLHARLMSQALRKLTSTISKTNCTVFFINQLREKIGVMFGNPETTTGGNALKFYASVRLDIRRSTQLKDSTGNAMGNKTRVKVVKNKVAPPFKVCEFDIMYGEGISKVGEILDIGTQAGIVDKSGSWFSYGDTKLGQGRDAVKNLLKDNPELCDELEGKISETLNSSD